MTTLYQRPLSDFEVYHPTDDERSRGRWAIVHEKWNGQEPDWSSTAHVMPIYDQKHHKISEKCWCSPERSANGAIVHKASQ